MVAGGGIGEIPRERYLLWFHRVKRRFKFACAPKKLPTHIRLDTAPAKTVPDDIGCSRTAMVYTIWLLQQSYQFYLLSEEGIMPVIAGHEAVVGRDAGSTDGMSKVTD